MKTLQILRHAKAETGDMNMDDFNRALAPRGIEDAQRLGNYLSDDNTPDSILCSSAIRTVQTYENMASAWQSLPDASYHESLYLASTGTLMRLLQQQVSSITHILLIGHNPGLHQLALTLTDNSGENACADIAYKFPTCAMAEIGFSFDSWDKLAPACGTLTRYLTRHDIM